MGKRRLSRSFAVKNERRIELLRQRQVNPLTPAEAAELQSLTEWVDREVDRVYPLPAFQGEPKIP